MDTDTQYGFKWGSMAVTRLAHFRPRGKAESRVIEVSTDAGKKIQVYVSRTGRSLRVFQDGKEMH